MDFEGIGNVTTRKGHNLQKPKMAHGPARDLGGSLLIESILSQDETKDVLTMMIAADEYDRHNQIPSFCTSPIIADGIAGRVQHDGERWAHTRGQRERY